MLNALIRMAEGEINLFFAAQHFDRSTKFVFPLLSAMFLAYANR